jgi:signal transduction histidine kinase/CheY-like chemotaxis protein
MFSLRWLLICCMYLLLLPAQVSALDNAVHGKPTAPGAIVVLDKANVRLNLARHALVLEDPQQQYVVSQLGDDANLPWQPVTGTHINKGKNTSAWWLTVLLDNRTEQALDGVLEINYPILDRVELFHIDPQRRMHHQKSGDHLLLEERPLQVRNPWLTISLPSGINRIYVRVESSSTVFVPLYFATWPAAAARLEISSLAHGVFYGVLLGLFAYNLFLFASLRETSYFWYLIYTLNMLLFMAAFDGLLWKWLPMSIGIQSGSIYSLMFLHCIVATQFSRHFLHTAAHFHRIDRLLLSVIILVAITLLSFPLIGLAAYNLLASLFVLSTSAILLATGIYVWRQGFRYGLYYTLAWSVLLGSLMLSTVGSLGYELAVSYGTDWVKLGICLELFILSLGLADRIRTLKEARFKADEQARQARLEARAKGRFLAKMSHEIRTPLNGVLGMLHLLHHTPLNQTQQFYVDTINSSGNTLMSVINAVLDYARIESGHVQLEQIEFDLEELLSSTCSLFTAQAVAKQLELYCCIDPQVPRKVIGDPTRLNQILLNLLGNGMKFTSRGHVTLQVSRRDNNQTQGYCLLQFQVTDTGIGIGPETQNELFDSFTQADSSTTRRYGGSGLGLAISQELAALMGSRIEITSALDEGSTFSFELSLGTVEGSTSNQNQVPLSGFAMLIGSDQAALECYGAMLIRLGLSVQTLLANEYLAKPPDDCLLVVSTAGMNTTDLSRLETLLAERRQPSLLLSSVATPDNQSATNDNVVSTCRSPVTPDRLREALDTLTRSSNAVQADEPQRATLRRQARVDRITVLVAVDNPVNQMVVRGLLERYDCTVVLANDGAEAVHLYKADAQRFQLVLMDGEMPHMDGFEATRQIRAYERSTQLPAVTIVALTAHVLDIHREAGAKAGMDVYLAKPLQAQALYAVIDRLLSPGINR